MLPWFFSLFLPPSYTSLIGWSNFHTHDFKVRTAHETSALRSTDPCEGASGAQTNISKVGFTLFLSSSSATLHPNQKEPQEFLFTAPHASLLRASHPVALPFSPAQLTLQCRLHHCSTLRAVASLQVSWQPLKALHKSISPEAARKSLLKHKSNGTALPLRVIH